MMDETFGAKCPMYFDVLKDDNKRSRFGEQTWGGGNGMLTTLTSYTHPGKLEKTINWNSYQLTGSMPSTSPLFLQSEFA